MVLQRMVVGVDFSPASQEAAKLACFFRDAIGSKIFLIHVHDDVHDIRKGLLGRFRSEETHTSGVELEKLDQRLSAFASEVFRPAGVKDERAHVEDLSVRLGRPAEAIAEYARHVAADVLCVGTSGRGGVERLLLGSVAAELVRTSGIAVLTVPAKTER